MATRRVFSCLCLGFILSLALAQGASEAQLGEARAKAEAALETYAGTMYNIDQTLWREAIGAAEAALQQSPENPEALALLAQIHSYIRWHIRAWGYWQRYLDTSATFNSVRPLGETSATEQFAEAGNELGFARYERNDFEGALGYYGGVAEVLPENEEALTWLGRIHLEQGRPDEALPYWERLASIAPDSPDIAYFNELASEQRAFGVEASTLYRQGLRAYEAGELEDALEQFEAAIDENDAFTQVYVWAGRTSLELGRSSEAVGYWEEVLERNPDDERASYFLDVARTQQRWGVAATEAYYEGLQLYEEADIEAAADAFASALRSNRRFVDAAVWLARSYQETEREDEAADAWEQVLELDPEDSRARYFLNLLRPEVSLETPDQTFERALRAFQAGEFALAESGFLQVVEAEPERLQAWTLLGRLYFTTARYEEAAESYERALMLEPGNEDYQFFYEEASRLAED